MQGRNSLQLMNANLKIGLQCFTEDGVFNALLEGHTPTGTEELKAFKGSNWLLGI